MITPLEVRHSLWSKRDYISETDLELLLIFFNRFNPSDSFYDNWAQDRLLTFKTQDNFIQAINIDFLKSLKIATYQ